MSELIAEIQSADGGTTPALHRLLTLAQDDPHRPAVTVLGKDGATVCSRRDLMARAADAAAALYNAGARAGEWTVVALPTSLEQVLATIGAWWNGSGVLPLSPGLRPSERDALLALARPRVVVSTWTDRSDVGVADLMEPAQSTPPIGIADPGRAVATGGSTGQPKLVLHPGVYGHCASSAELFQTLGMAPAVTTLMPLPLHHSFGFDWCHQGLLLGQHIILMERFDAAAWADAVEELRPEYAVLVPTMMRRIAALPGIEQRDLSSLQTLFHSAGPCPPAVKRAWLALIRPERLLEAYGATEGYGNTVVRGDEWLARPGTVGRALKCDLKVLDEQGVPSPAGVVGEIWMRREGVGDRYVGATARLRSDGFGSVGDLGHLDTAGYLYLADRRDDLIVSGGTNIYPAEVEAALLEHPAVADVAVVGLPDEEWGQRVHAVVQPVDQERPLELHDLVVHCCSRLEPHKRPRSFEVVHRLPRDEGGKLRRAQLRQDAS